MSQQYGDNGNPGRRGPIDVGDLNLPMWSSRSVRWVAAGTLVLFLIIGLSWGKSVYTDWLWFDSLGYVSVFRKILTTRIWLFFASAAIFAVLLVPNIYLVFRFTRGDTPTTLTRAAYEAIRRALALAAAVAAIVAAAAVGAAAAGRWETVLKYLNATPFTQVNEATGVAAPLVEPIFNKGVDFYVFTLPFLGFIRGWFLGAAVVILIIVLGLYLVLFGLRERNVVIPLNVKVHVAAIGAVLFPHHRRRSLDRPLGASILRRRRRLRRGFHRRQRPHNRPHHPHHRSPHQRRTHGSRSIPPRLSHDCQRHRPLARHGHPRRRRLPQRGAALSG